MLIVPCLEKVHKTNQMIKKKYNFVDVIKQFIKLRF